MDSVYVITEAGVTRYEDMSMLDTVLVAKQAMSRGNVAVFLNGEHVLQHHYVEDES